MSAPSPTQPNYRFSIFEVDPSAGELRRNGVRLRIQDQPFQILLRLLERPGKVVTREELKATLWHADTFVDFDNGLNMAVKRLRETLADDADRPTFIETIPRKGYRFIAEVEGYVVPNTKPAAALPPKGRFDRLKKWGWISFVFVTVVLLGVIASSRLWQKPAESLNPSIEVVPLVAMEGKQGWPALSFDGNHAAFAEFEGPNPGIYTTLIGEEKSLRLTENPHDCCPTWSPDGRQIAFVRYEPGRKRSFYSVSALGGSEHRLYTGFFNGRTFCDHLDWSPDGTALVFPEHEATGFRARIARLSLSDLTTHELTSPQTVAETDCDPAFSPDGLHIAFVRGLSGGDFGDLFMLTLSNGKLVQLTAGNSGGNLAWTPDGKEIVFSSVVGGLQRLWRIPVSGGSPRPLEGIGGPAYRPSISRRGGQLVYQQIVRNDNIWRIDLRGAKPTLGPAVRAFSGRGLIQKPSFSPDGKKVAFGSDRLGYLEIWLCESDGSNCAQLTSLHSTSGTPRWSPDGRYISFESAPQQFWQVYVVEVPGGRPHLLPTFPKADTGTPTWSRDGNWIYFYSDYQSGILNLWKVPSKGGTPVQVTRKGGLYGVESADGRFVYYEGQLGGIWRVPLSGGEESMVLNQPVAWYNWVLTHDGIYFVNASVKPNGRIEFLNLVTREITPIFSLERPTSEQGGLVLSPDGKSLFYGQTDQDDSYDLVVKNFR